MPKSGMRRFFVEFLRLSGEFFTWRPETVCLWGSSFPVFFRPYGRGVLILEVVGSHILIYIKFNISGGRRCLLRDLARSGVGPCPQWPPQGEPEPRPGVYPHGKLPIMRTAATFAGGPSTLRSELPAGVRQQRDFVSVPRVCPLYAAGDTARRHLRR